MLKKILRLFPITLSGAVSKPSAWCPAVQRTGHQERYTTARRSRVKHVRRPGVWYASSNQTPTMSTLHVLDPSTPREFTPQTGVALHSVKCPTQPRHTLTSDGWSVGNPTGSNTAASHIRCMVSQSVPTGSDLHPCAKRTPTQTDGIAEASRQSAIPARSCPRTTCTARPSSSRRTYRRCEGEGLSLPLRCTHRKCEEEGLSLLLRRTPRQCEEEGSVPILPPPWYAATMLMYTPKL